MEPVDPKSLGLPPRTIVYKTAPKNYVIRIDRKSRIIMKDANKLLEKAETICKANPGATVAIETSAPVCSKSTIFLSERGIGINAVGESSG